MRSLRNLFLILPLLMTPWLLGCQTQMSQESAEELSDQIAEEDAAATTQDAPLDDE